MKSYSKSTGITSRNQGWPAVNADLIERVAERGQTLAQLRTSSPISLTENRIRTDDVIDGLFENHHLLCVGFNKHRYATETREHWRGRLAKYPHILPSPMLAKASPTTAGKLSPRAKENVATRRFLVVEFDPQKWEALDMGQQAAFGDDASYYAKQLDRQSALLHHLSQFAPLALVVFSGSKSLHGWFYCEGTDEGLARRFFEYAVALGADRQLWTVNQLVRMPDGTRKDKSGERRQTVRFFNPSAVTGKDANGYRGTWAEMAGIPAMTSGQLLTTEASEDRDCSQDTQDTHETQDTQLPNDGERRDWRLVDVGSIEAVIAATQPTKPNDTDGNLFNLARGVKGWEKRMNRPYDLETLRSAVFDPWHEQAAPFLDKGRCSDDYFAEFVAKCEKAKHPLDVISIRAVWDEVLSEPLPELPSGLRAFGEAVGLRQTIALCRKLAIIHQGKPFPLSTRKLAELLGHPNNSTAQHWMTLLKGNRVGILREVSKGRLKGRMASEYVYLLPIEPNRSGEELSLSE